MMRTGHSNHSTSALAQLRDQLGRAWSWLGSQAASTRWALGLAALFLVAAAGYFALPADPIGYERLYGGHQFSADEILNINKLLTAKTIPMKAEGGRVSVPRDQLAEAQGILDKAGAGPRSIWEDLEPLQPGIFDSPTTVEEKHRRQLEHFYEAAIRNIDPSLSATVFLERSRQPGRSLNPAETVRVTAYLQAEGDRLIAPKTIEEIQQVLVGLVRDLKPEGLTLIDRKGRTYLDPANPAFVTRSRARVREEELTSDIAAQLNWIDDVRVWVRIEPAPAAGTTQPPQQAPAPPSEQIAVNAPLALESPAAAAPLAAATSKARILIQVPISYYVQHFRSTETGHEPSPEELRPYVQKTEEVIKRTVEHVVPATEFGSLTIDKINSPRPNAPSIPDSASEPHRVAWWWIPLGAAAPAAALVLVSSRLLAARRPASQAAAHSRHNRIDRGEPVGAGPGPAERVRELVRMSPEAAAGVLQRWIGQGGHPQ